MGVVLIVCTWWLHPLHPYLSIYCIPPGVRSLLENVPRISEEFEVVSKIGEGTFSSVYLGRLKGCGGGGSEMKFALKHLVPTSASLRIENELKCLQSMGLAPARCN